VSTVLRIGVNAGRNGQPFTVGSRISERQPSAAGATIGLRTRPSHDAAHLSSRRRCAGVRPNAVLGAISRVWTPRGASLRRAAAGRPPTRWSSHHANALTSGLRSSQASTAASFHQTPSGGVTSVGLARTGQSGPGKGSMLARISEFQLLNHQQETPGALPSASSRAHRVGEVRTGPKTWPTTTSSPHAVPASPIGETTPSMSQMTARADSAGLTREVWQSATTAELTMRRLGCDPGRSFDTSSSGELGP
jgi:hypothetical protein